MPAGFMGCLDMSGGADAGARAVQGHRDQCTGFEFIRGRRAVGTIEAMGPQMSSSPYLVGRQSHSRRRSP
jgi:hypothetical protein